MLIKQFVLIENKNSETYLNTKMVRTDDEMYVASLLLPDEEYESNGSTIYTANSANSPTTKSANPKSKTPTDIKSGLEIATSNGRDNDRDNDRASSSTSTHSDLVVSVSDAITDITEFVSDLVEGELFYFSSTCMSDKKEFEARFTNFLKYNYKKGKNKRSSY